MAANDDPPQPWKFFPKPGELPPSSTVSENVSDLGSSPPLGLESAPLDSGSGSARSPIASDAIPLVPAARPLIESEPVSEVAMALPPSEVARVVSSESGTADALASGSEVAPVAPARADPKGSDRLPRRAGARSSARVVKRTSSAHHVAARTHSGGSIPAARRGRGAPANGALVGVFGALGVAAFFLMVAHQGSSEPEGRDGRDEPVQVAKASPPPVRFLASPSPSPLPARPRDPVPERSSPEDEAAVETVAPPRTDLVPPVADDDPSSPLAPAGPDQTDPDPNMPGSRGPDAIRPDPNGPDSNGPDSNKPDPNRPEGAGGPDRPQGSPAPVAASPEPGGARPGEPKLRPGEVVERNADGSIKARFSTDKQGRRSGPYVEYHPNGKIAVKATYRAGALHGTRSELAPNGRLLKRAAYRNDQLHGEALALDPSGRVLSQEYWFEGILLYPKTQEAIERRLREIAGESIEGPQGPSKLPDFEPYSAQGQIKALRKLRAFRYLCDVPTDVTLSRPYGELASASAQLLEIVGHLDHNPPRPVGVPDSLYVPGLQGLQEGNLHEHSERRGDALLLGGIDFWIWDSDPTNIGRVGHRRWSLNPRMKEVAWGVRDKFTVMYSHDSARAASARDFVAYPSRGFFPISYLEKLDGQAAWSCAFDQGAYSVAADAKVEVCPADDKLRKGPPLEIHDFVVESGGYAQGTAVIFRPEVVVAVGARYWVTITGVRDASGKPVRVQYFVELVK